MNPAKMISATSLGSTHIPLRPRSSSGTLPKAGVARRSGCSFFHSARGLGAIAGARAARIAQSAVLVKAEHERADRAPEMRRILVADDHEFLVLPALRLDPGVVAFRAVGRIAPLRDQAFQVEPAGVRVHFRARDV